MRRRPIVIGIAALVALALLLTGILLWKNREKSEEDKWREETELVDIPEQQTGDEAQEETEEATPSEPGKEPESGGANETTDESANESANESKVPNQDGTDTKPSASEEPTPAQPVEKDNTIVMPFIPVD